MKLVRFIKNNHIKLSPKIFGLCQTALNLMKSTGDVVHGIKHIESILKNLDFLIKDKKLKKKINFSILLRSICWHDVWISGKKTGNIPKLIYFQFIEGLKSAYIFKSYAKKVNLEKSLTTNVFYAIRKHSSFQILPTFQMEARILVDLDKLEIWNHVRFFDPKAEFLSKKEFYQKYLVRFYYFYNSKIGLYFKELDRTFKRSVKKFFSQIS
jgi:hypothetical protein